MQGFFSKLLATKNQPGNRTAGLFKVNTWQWKMVSFLGSTNTCMINQCTTDYTKSEKIKVYSQNVFTWKVPRVANISCKLMVNDFTEPMPQVAKLQASLWSKAPVRLTNKKQSCFLTFSLCFFIAYTNPGLNSIKLHFYSLKSTLSVHWKCRVNLMLILNFKTLTT